MNGNLLKPRWVESNVQLQRDTAGKDKIWGNGGTECRSNLPKVIADQWQNWFQNPGSVAKYYTWYTLTVMVRMFGKIYRYKNCEEL